MATGRIPVQKVKITMKLKATATAVKPQAKPLGLLWECTLSFDAVTGVRTLRLNGADYDVGVVPPSRAVGGHPGGYWLENRRAKKKQPWNVTVDVCDMHCDCPASKFNARPCKHQLCVGTGILDVLNFQKVLN